MDKSIQYVQVMSNFNSVYNAPLNLNPQPTTYIPMSSSATFGSLSNRSSSPLFRRCKSPPPRQPILPESGPKFNFDLYKMDENNNNQYDGYSSPSYRSLSPSSSRIIYHHPTHSPLSSPTSKTQALSKLRQINDELCQTLARSELTNPSQQLPLHYHIHHYPLSQHPYENYRSESTSEDYSPEVSPNLHKARVKYKIHIPQHHRQEQQQQQHRKSSRHKSISDVSSSDDTITIDLYPTRDQGFVKQVRKHSDNQSPWVVDGTSLRRDSYSDTKTSRTQHTPKGPYYGDKPIKPHRRSHRGKEPPSSSSRHRSPYVSSRNRSNSAQLNTSDPYHESNASFSNTKPAWRPNGAHAPPSKPKSSSREASWKPTGIANKTKHIRALKPESDVSITEKRIIIDGTESEPIPQRKILSNRTKIRNGDSKLKKRIANAESKVKSAWEPTITGLSQSTSKEAKPPIPRLLQQRTTITTPPKIKSVPSEPATPIKKVVTAPPQLPTTNTNTDRSSLNDIPTKPIFESTPRNQSIVDENDDSAADLFGNESRTSEQSKKQELPQRPPQVEKITTEQPRKPSAELPKSTVPEPDKDTKPTIKHDESIHGNDNQASSSASQADNKNDDEESSAADSVQPTPQPPEVPTSERKASSAKSDNKKDESVVDEDEDENDQEVARSFDINKWLNGASKAIFGAIKKGDTPPPPPPPSSQPPPTSNAKSPPRRKEPLPSPPPAESPDHNLYKPPFGPKNKDQKPATPPPPPTDDTDDAEDFFS